VIDLRRRDILLFAAAAPLLTGCERFWSGVAEELGERIPDRIAPASSIEIDPAFHLLSRAAYGPRPGERERVSEIGSSAWLDAQLDPDSIDDRACDVRARRFETIHLEPGLAFEFDDRVLREELVRHTMLRAIYSKRQLLEVMTSFWTDHFNVDVGKGDVIHFAATSDRAIRKNALGSFRELVRSSVTSGAMLLYLDGASSKKGSPNENHARELLELHTLGVNGGYTQSDVRETARALTGWRVGTSGWKRGEVSFDPAEHDDGPKTILGTAIPSGLGAGDVDRVVDIVCAHPSTAKFIARKLARRFVSDDPPDSIVLRAAADLQSGEIAKALRTILLSDELMAARGKKLKRPMQLIASALRATAADTHARPEIVSTLARLGQPLFAWPTPDGFPDRGEAWIGTLLWRWNFAFALAANEIPNVHAPIDELVRAIGDAHPVALFAHFVGRAPNVVERQLLEAHRKTEDAIGVILASPAFQRC
jgi:hypothetical protein